MAVCHLSIPMSPCQSENPLARPLLACVFRQFRAQLAHSHGAVGRARALGERAVGGQFREPTWRPRTGILQSRSRGRPSKRAAGAAREAGSTASDCDRELRAKMAVRRYCVQLPGTGLPGKPEFSQHHIEQARNHPLGLRVVRVLRSRFVAQRCSAVHPPGGPWPVTWWRWDGRPSSLPPPHRLLHVGGMCQLW